MGPTRRELLTGLGAASLVGCGARWRGAATASLDRGVAALWALQSPDGAFRSAKYGLLSQGWSLTPFALLALVRTGRPLDRAGASRALGWIAHGVRDGVVGLASDAPDYPCYATAMALDCFARLAPPGEQAMTRALAVGLRGFQLRAADGWADHVACGAFRMGSMDRPQPPHPGHVDLSMTRRAVEALATAGVPGTDPAMVQARGFAERCRTPLGRYVYTASETALNKGARDGSDAGYGTPTADAALLLHAAGDLPASAAALTQLRAMHRVDENPGVGQGAMKPYGPAMRGYYRAASARCFSRSGGPPGWQRALAEVVVAEQRADGSWASPHSEQKEDEPVIATAFAVVGLAAALGS